MRWLVMVGLLSSGCSDSITADLSRSEEQEICDFFTDPTHWTCKGDGRVWPGNNSFAAELMYSHSCEQLWAKLDNSYVTVDELETCIAAMPAAVDACDFEEIDSVGGACYPVACWHCERPLRME